MPEKVKIGIGDHLIIKDGNNEWAFIKEGTVVKLEDIVGTGNKRILLDPPAYIDVVR